ncbi:MAG: hypothetical protein A2X64_03260 [Ignavibacteria bacterium GWF2_33_9]|nr:MAG: hypothetical protein A2X64_03260 [Ignavibacteria bacterium GWF2_33_9]
MNSAKRIFLMLIVVLISTTTINAQKEIKGKVPLNPSVLTGKLSNGLTYYIMKNQKPEQRAELRLVVHAGSINEDDDQKGLAHFCEHMEFNGTKSFPRSELVDYIESIGMQFGADLNAYTNFNQTVYMLQVPTDKEELLLKGLQIIEEWGHLALFEDKEIDKERGVILEEERLYRGADERIWKQQLPVIFKGSKYADRDVIGDTNIIAKAPYDVFRRFYKEWYRPNNMAVIAIGDFDLNLVEKVIKERFSKMKNPDKYREGQVYPIPDNKGIIVSVLTDKELSYPQIGITYKHPKRAKDDFSNFRSGLVESLISNMMYSRYNEYMSKPNPPFLYAFPRYGSFEGDKDAFEVNCIGKGDDIEYSFQIMLTELFRAYQTGFTQSELDRAIQRNLAYAEKAIKEKDKTESRNYANRLISTFLTGNSFTSPEQNMEYMNVYYPTITLDEINAFLPKMVTKDNTIITIATPEKEGVKVPSNEEVLSIYNDYYSKKYDAYVDVVTDKPLFSRKVTPGTITSEKKNEKLDWTEFTLSNGAKVIVKKTDFKNDQILFEAFSPGGYSLAETENLFNANTASSIIDKSGLGEFDDVTLQKMLAGKIVNVGPYIYPEEEGLSGSSSVTDFELLMQMINMYFTEPRIDKDAFEAYKSQRLDQITMFENDPDMIFSDSISAVLYNYNPRVKRMDRNDVNLLDLSKVFEFYKDRFKDASDFTFVFVGSVDMDKVKEFAKKYIASLPSINRKESWIDRNIVPVEKTITKTVKKGIEFKSSVNLFQYNDFEYTPINRLILRALNEVINIRLREVIREDKGGTYGAYASLRGSKIPRERMVLYSGFGCSPDRVEELTIATIDIFKELQDKPVDQKYVEKVHETFLREIETARKENNWWQQIIHNSVQYNEDQSFLLDYEKMVQNINAKTIQDAAKQYLDVRKIDKFFLFPEDKD